MPLIMRIPIATVLFGYFQKSPSTQPSSNWMVDTSFATLSVVDLGRLGEPTDVVTYFWRDRPRLATFGTRETLVECVLRIISLWVT